MNAFYIPYRVCLYWDSDSKSTSLFIIELCTDLLFGFDIFLNFFTSYYDRAAHKMVNNLSQIGARYLKGYFLVDVFATFPFGYIIGSNNQSSGSSLGQLPKVIKFFRAIRLLKLLRVYKLQQFILKLEVEYNIHHGISRMIKLVIMVLVVTHVVGCLWFLIGLSGGTDTLNGGWMYRFAFNDKPISAKYVASLYWAFSTLTTVGYGDITARTPQEQIYSMIMMLLGVSWYAYVVSSMSTIMNTFDAQNKAIRDKLICVNSFIRSAKLPRPIAKQIKNYFEFRLSNSQFACLINQQYDADEILNELGSSLRSEVLLFMEEELISKIPFFNDKVPQFVADAITMFQPMVFQESDYIVREGTQADEMCVQ